MTLGSHELKGKVEDLKQPFVVMRKKRKRDDADHSSATGASPGKGGSNGGDDRSNDCTMMDMNTCEKSSVSSAVTYEVAGIVKKKMLFDNYPKSIMR